MMETTNKVLSSKQTKRNKVKHEELSKRAFKKLRELHLERRPGVRVPIYNDNTANSLTRCILDYLQLKNYQAERINCTGHPIPIGNGAYTFSKTKMDKGTADISATVNSISVKIEVKVGKDRMSFHQLKYKEKVEQAGGVYIIARTFLGFLREFHTKIIV